MGIYISEISLSTLIMIISTYNMQDEDDDVSVSNHRESVVDRASNLLHTFRKS
jgi:hypothetical protein